MKSVISLLSACLSMLFAQINEFDEQQFFKSIQESYYTLANTDVKNFTALVTSLKMEKFAEENWQSKEIFPLQLIWFSPEKLYLSQQGVPTIKDNRYQEYQEIVDGIKQQMRGILLDLQRFYFVGLFESIANNYALEHDDKFVWINYNAGSDSIAIPVKYTMGRNGLCLKIELTYPVENKQIMIYPSFKTMKTKWLCDGWSVQTMLNGEVINGYVLEIINLEIEKVWVPGQINIGVQRADDPAHTYYDIIKLKNYLFNQSLELINNSN